MFVQNFDLGSIPRQTDSAPLRGTAWPPHNRLAFAADGAMGGSTAEEPSETRPSAACLAIAYGLQARLVDIAFGTVTVESPRLGLAQRRTLRKAPR